MRKLSSLICLGFLPCLLLAQSPLERRTSISLDNELLENALLLLSEQTEIGFSFSSDIFPPDAKVTTKFWRAKVRTILAEILAGSSIQYKLVNEQIVFFLPRLPVDGQNFTISGFIKNRESGELLIGANVVPTKGETGSFSNDYGFYSITLPSGLIDLNVSYLGHQPIIKEIHLVQDTILNFSLSGSITLSEVVITASDLTKAAQVNTKIKQSADRIKVAQLMSFPRLAGETDVLRTSFMLPGVQSGADGVGGLFIRGGDADQNLVLLDGATVYNPLHALGIFSVFNSNSIKSARLIKGNFPARYGGRLSSILDVRTKEGNNQKFGGQVGLSLISADVTFEGPIQKGKSSFFFTGRRAFTDLYFKPLTTFFKSQNDETGFASYYFYDLNVKLNHSFSNKDKVFFSFYTGGDNFHDETAFTREEESSFFTIPIIISTAEDAQQEFDWGNTIASLRWNHVIGPKLFSNTTATFSNFRYSSKDFFESTTTIKFLDDLAEQNLLAITQYSSDIKDYGLKIDFDYALHRNHLLSFGAGAIHHKFRPGLVDIDNELQLLLFQDLDIDEVLANSPTTQANEFKVYAENQMILSRSLSADLGLYASAWSNEGKQYFSLEPRVQLRYSFSKDLYVVVAFSTMTQYLHLLSNSGIGLPIDLWMPSTDQIAPRRAWQTSAGINYISDNFLQIGIEAYYKKMNDLTSFLGNTGTVNLDARNWENEVTTGTGTSYGLEFSVKKQQGNFTSWLSYTLSRAERQFDEINNGEVFPFKYDRRHDLKIVLAYQFNDNIDLSANWVYGSGSAITLPTNKYFYPLPLALFPDQPADNIDAITVTNYGTRNGARLPAYHRLDFGINFHQNKAWGKQLVTIGAYNLYNRKNPLYYQLRTDRNDLRQKELVQVSLLPFIPSLSYRITFE